jgi:hypothetical protein
MAFIRATSAGFAPGRRGHDLNYLFQSWPSGMVCGEKPQQVRPIFACPEKHRSPNFMPIVTLTSGSTELTLRLPESSALVIGNIIQLDAFGDGHRLWTVLRLND